MSTIDYGHAEHEARHTVCCWYFDGLRPTYLRVGRHATEEGVMGVNRTGPLTPASLVVSLVGWLSDPNLPDGAVWPEPWPVREKAPEGIGVLVRELGLTQEQHERCCEIAEELVTEDTFLAAVDLVARAAMIAPSIDAKGLDILREAAGFPELEGAPV